MLQDVIPYNVTVAKDCTILLQVESTRRLTSRKKMTALKRQWFLNKILCRVDYSSTTANQALGNRGTTDIRTRIFWDTA